jgi:hypothetical protein
MVAADSGSSIQRRILTLRGQSVMLDFELARLYGVKTRHLNEQVRRNRKRFPEDFTFQLNAQERDGLKLPRSRRRGHRPWAFTEQGAGMLTSVLRGPVVDRISIEILRAFARLREEQAVPLVESADQQLGCVFTAIRNAVARLREDSDPTTSEPCTYFLQAGDGGPIKIGSTRNLRVRLGTLRAMSPIQLRLLGVIRGDAEDQCHRRLAAFRVHGEWFAPSPFVLEFICQNASMRETRDS